MEKDNYLKLFCFGILGGNMAIKGKTHIVSLRTTENMIKISKCIYET